MRSTFIKSGFALFIFAAFAIFSCNQNTKKQNKSAEKPLVKSGIGSIPDSIVYQSGNLILRRLSPHVYQHISYLNTHDYGKVECNGMVAVNGNQAVIFDTPANDSSSEELINYVTKNLQSNIIAVIPTHFHADCVGGLKTFNEHHIPGYASFKTIQILKTEGNENASFLKGFTDNLTLNVGGENVYSEYLGEGHTKDNVVGYFPEDSVLFGGCLIKELGAGKGYLGDANVKAWPATVLRLKQKYPQAKIVIPGHGKPGGTELLDYTIALFK
jgi:metallo-beta-lactamase class B